MSVETQLRPPETISDLMPPSLAMDIANGLCTPTYDQFVAYGTYVAEFKAHRSSMDIGIEIYTRTDPTGNKTLLSSDGYRQFRAVAQPDHWLLDDAEQANIKALLEATSLQQLPNPGRHRTQSTPEEDAATLQALQGDALARVTLDHDIRLAQLWARSHHATRLGLSGTALSSSAIEALTGSSLIDRLNYVTPANPLSPEDVVQTVALQAEEKAQTATATQQTKPEQSPAKWGRIKRVVHAIMTFGLDS